MRVLAVDPGREKAGIAVCGPGEVVARRVVPSAALAAAAREWADLYRVRAVVLGNSTGAGDARRQLGEIGVPIVSVDERGTTLRARARYFSDHPPRGWRRFVPRSFLTPPEPYDDYAAVLIAESYFAARGAP